MTTWPPLTEIARQHAIGEPFGPPAPLEGMAFGRHLAMALTHQQLPRRMLT
jgi:hypothetical protein